MVKFPYDVQDCSIQLWPMGNPDIIIDVESSLGLDMQYFTKSNEFEVVSTKTQESVFRVGFRTHSKDENFSLTCLTEIRTHLIIYIHYFLRDVITHPCHSINGGLAKLSLMI